MMAVFLNKKIEERLKLCYLCSSLAKAKAEKTHFSICLLTKYTKTIVNARHIFTDERTYGCQILS